MARTINKVNCEYYCGETLSFETGLSGKVFVFGDIEIIKYSNSYLGDAYKGYNCELGEEIKVESKYIKAIKRLEIKLEKLEQERLEKINYYPIEIIDIISMTLFYKNRVSSFDYKGIKFYEVGHNASHIFSAGYDFDSKKYYVLAIDCNCDLEEEEMYNLREVRDKDWGYLGHC